MERKIHIKFIIVVALILCAAGTPVLPEILMIGDSISLGYTPFVKEYFKGKAVIVHSPGNAGHSGMGLENIREWIGKRDWNVIQFNFGLWDLCYRHPDSELYGNRDKINGTITFSVDDYAANLDSIVTILKKISDAKLIFVTTTYVPEEEGGRYAKDVKKYNRAAKEVMKKHDVLVNDIYKESIGIHKRNGTGSDDVHYTEKGYEQLAKIIGAYLEKTLQAKK